MPKLTTRNVETMKEVARPPRRRGRSCISASRRPGPGPAILRTVVHKKRRDIRPRLVLFRFAGAGTGPRSGDAQGSEAGRRPAVRLDGGETLSFATAAETVHASLAPTWRQEAHRELARLGSRAMRTRSLARGRSTQLAPRTSFASSLRSGRRSTRRRGRAEAAPRQASSTGPRAPVTTRMRTLSTGCKKGLPPVKRRNQTLSGACPGNTCPRSSPTCIARGRLSPPPRVLILTAARSGEARGARWDEIEGGVWTVPASA